MAFLLTFGSACGQEPQVEDRGTTTSSSGQFLVRGAISGARVEMATLAEEVRNDFLDLVRAKDMRWALPIGVEMLPGDDSKGGVRTSVELVGGKDYRLSVLTKPGEAMSEKALREAFLKVILLEVALRGVNPDELQDGQLLPEWLWRGVSQALEFRRDPEKAKLFKQMLENGEFLSVGELLSKPYTERTSVGKTIYDASAGALVLTLVNQINGPTRFLQLIREAPIFRADPKRMINRSFRNIKIDADGLEKWWALQIVEMAKPEARDLWTPVQTVERIRRAMRLIYEVEGDQPDASKLIDIPVANLVDIEADDDRSLAVGGARQRVADLISKVHPAYRPIVKDLVEVYGELLDDTVDGLARVDQLMAEMDRMTIRLDDVRDYMNWTEVLQTKNGSDLSMFDDFFRTLDEIREPPEQREDAISNYLDVIEREFE